MATSTVESYPAWESGVIQDLGAKPTLAGLTVLNRIQAAEGMPDAAHNWLAITETSPNEWGDIGTDPLIKNDVIAPGVWNSAGVTTYAAASGGEAAIADFIQHGHPLIEAALTDPHATTDQVAQAFVQDGAWAGDDNSILAGGSSVYNAKTGGGGRVYTGGSATNPEVGVMCSNRPAILSIPGLGVGPLHTPEIPLFTPCEAKAIVGGFLVAGGAVIMIVGLTMLVSRSSEVRGVVGSIKKVAGVAGRFVA